MRKHAATSMDGDFKLVYSETVSKCEDDEAVLYGIHVEKYVKGSLEEEMESGPLSDNPVVVSELIRKLSENTVTPFALCEILDEMEIWDTL